MLDFLLPLLLFLLPLAVWSGYRIGRKAPKGKMLGRSLAPGYFTGLNFLLNEQPDKAIDAFITLLQVDSETVETHLALGNLFRRRGEVDRAIRIHQNLIARPALTGAIRKLALLELAYDYMAAGLFDRAENLFIELVKDKPHQAESLNHLVIIYQQIKDWPQAIEYSYQIEKITGINQGSKIAHFQCEIAADERSSGNLTLAQDALKKALKADKNSVRASILQGQIYKQTDKNKEAINSFRRVRHQDIAYMSEVLTDLNSCYRLVGNEAELLKFLKECLDQGAGVSVLLTVAELLETSVNDKEAAYIIVNYLREHPSLKGLEHLIDLHVKHASDSARDNLQLLHSLVIKLIDKKPVYRCDGCGYSGKTLFWKCPSCKEWGTIKPILGIEGE
ncbi:MAG: lipopolysaccharide biosynthesis regulator YciM [Enterobacterales bacterium]|jgi:lipopolysaccharide biosynthesis regulator YciM